MNIKKIAYSLLNFVIKRLAEIFGIIIFATGMSLLISLISYSPEDPNFIFPDNTKINNILGFHGAFISDLFLQSIGLISYLISFTLIITGINIFRSKEFFLIINNIFFSIIYIVFGSLFLNHFYGNGYLLHINGNGGFVGNYLDENIS
jgi:S-DNA-T family DNA segregation ATPase FtsK/SpoIIIE